MSDRGWRRHVPPKIQLQPNKRISASQSPGLSLAENKRRELKMCRLNKQARWYFRGGWGARIVAVASSESKYTHAHTSSLGTILCFIGANPVLTPWQAYRCPCRLRGTRSAPLKCSIQSVSARQNVLKWPTCANKLAACSPRSTNYDDDEGVSKSWGVYKWHVLCRNIHLLASCKQISVF